MDVGHSAYARVRRALDEAGSGSMTGAEVAGIVVASIVAAVLLLVLCACGTFYCVSRSAGSAIRRQHDKGASSTRTTIVTIEPPSEIRMAPLAASRQPQEQGV